MKSRIMIKQKNPFVSILLVLICVLCMTCTTHPGKEPPVIYDGFINLSNWDFEMNGIVDLKGDWKFKWLQDDPDVTRMDYDDADWDTFKMPGNWNQKIKEIFGYCWFRLRLKLKPQRGLALYCKMSLTSAEFYINGEKTMETGKAGNTRETTIPRAIPAIIPLPQGITDCVISWKISNFILNPGGPSYGLQLGTLNQVTQQIWIDELLSNIILGITLMMFCYHFILWLERKNDKASFYFFILCAIVFLRYLNSQLEIIFPFHIPSLMFTIRVRMEYILTSGLLILFLLYLYEFFSIKKSDKFKQSIVAVLAIDIIVCILIWIMPVWIFVRYLIIYHVVIFGFCFYILSILINECVHKKKEAPYILLGWIIISIVIANDIVIQHIKPTWFYHYIIHYGIMVFLILQSIMLSKRFSVAFKKAEYLSENLKQEVLNQTVTLTNQKKELELYNTKLKEIDKYKTQFFQNMTHELRTPLTMIVGPLEIISREFSGILPIKVREQITMTTRNAYQLLDLINQILDLSKLDAKQMLVYPEKFNVIALIDSIHKSFSSLAAYKDILSETRMSPEPVYIYSDKNKITRILFNLISNAYKFTGPGGKIYIDLEYPFSHENPVGIICRYVKIVIKDTGIGIPEKEVPYIFDRFRQVDGSSTRKFGGTGIGLSIVKEYMDLLKGILTVESSEGSGTVFTILLPASPDIVPDAGAAKTGTDTMIAMFNPDVEPGVDAPVTSPAVPCETAYRVLIAENNPDLRHFMHGILEQTYHVIDAEDGATAFHMILMEKPDVVLTDSMLPGMDGYSLLKRIRDNEKTRELPVIFLTAKTEQELRGGMPDVAPDDYLFKPFSMGQLLFCINNVLNCCKQKKEINRSWQHQFLFNEDMISMSRQAGRDFLCTDSEYNAQKKDIFLVEDNEELLFYLKENIQPLYNVFVARNGRAALDKIKKLPRRPGLIVSDIMMPVMDGWEFFKQLTEDREYLHVPFIFLTARVDEKLRGLSMGAVDYICKPFLIDEVISKIASLLKLQEQQKKINTAELRDKLLMIFKKDEKQTTQSYQFDEKCREYNITERERQVIQLVQRGYADKEIAYELNVSIHTINSHLKNIFRKCNSNCRIELLRKFSNN